MLLKIKIILKKYEELSKNIRDLIRSITRNTYNYGEKYIKTKLDSGDQLSLTKTIEYYNVTKNVRAVIHKNSKCHLQVFLDECLYES